MKENNEREEKGFFIILLFCVFFIEKEKEGRGEGEKGKREW